MNVEFSGKYVKQQLPVLKPHCFQADQQEITCRGDNTDSPFQTSMEWANYVIDSKAWKDCLVTDLVILTHTVQRNVHSKGGGIVVGLQEGLLIWFVPYYKGQVKLSL